MLASIAAATASRAARLAVYAAVHHVRSTRFTGFASYVCTPQGTVIVTVTRHQVHQQRWAKGRHKIDAMHVLAGEPSVLVSIAAATASRAARLAVCAVVHHVRSTRFT